MANLFQGLDHIGIKAKDMEKSIKFYTEVLGLSLVGRMKPGSVELVFLKLGDTVVELVEINDGGLFGDGVVNHVALKVSDIFSAVEHLKAHDVEMISSQPMSIGPERYNFFFRGPSGEKLELLQG
ncbi:MAG: VOC family protein [Desulfitobacteriaceae bacterium]